MRSLILTPDRNQIKKDWSGAFRPESLAFAKFHGIDLSDVVQVDISRPKPARVQQIVDAVNARAKNGPLDVVACFTHGLKNSLPQFGISPTQFAAIVSSTKSPSVVYALYACSTGDGAGADGDGGYGDNLRDASCRTGSVDCRVFSHTTAGHAVRNPNVRLFEGLGSPVGGVGGIWVVAPGSPLWRRWKRALQGDLRFRFPLMSVAAIHQELLAAA